MTTMKLAYSIAEFAELTSLGETTIREAISSRALIASYPNSKPIITDAEGRRWLESLPVEKPSRAS